MINRDLGKNIKIINKIYSQKMKINTASRIIDIKSELIKHIEKYEALRNKLITDHCNLDKDGKVIDIKEGMDKLQFYKDLNSLENSEVQLTINTTYIDKDPFFDELSPEELEVLKCFFYIGG